jgi:hypothetical protein
MRLTKLQINTKDQLLETLDCLANNEKQKRYKDSVPFVHIPIELLEQWSNYPRFINEERNWFIELFTPSQLSRILEFDKEVERFSQEREDDLEDVPDILKDDLWIKLGKNASILKNKLFEIPMICHQ